MHSTTLFLSLFAVLTIAAPLEAQARGKAHGRSSAGVPPGQLPPAGQCRIWLDGVPPGRQPGVTSCAEARRRVPPNGRVIYGDVAAFPGRGKGRWQNASQVGRENCRERESYRKNGDYKYDLECERGRRERRDADARRRQQRRTGSDVCIDRDRDGRCDVMTTRTSTICVDRDRDGRCDDTKPGARTDSSIDEMIEIMRRGGAPVP